MTESEVPARSSTILARRGSNGPRRPAGALLDDRLIAAFNVRMATRLGHIRFWQCVGEEGHA